jgi:bifunctional enzyme CysN/CysC
MTVDRSTITTFLEDQRGKSTLRFITCGSVDDGKSTLIGRLLYESKNIFDDQLKALESESRQYGTQGEKIDFALLVDGLQAEREQGITIDVAYRFFATDRRRYIVADTPGHEQYTRNMATGASTADLAVLLVDARRGLLTQTRRHSRIVHMMGIRHVVLAVNKMDLIDYDPARFAEIERDYEEFAADFGFASLRAIPLSGVHGDNVMVLSENTPWYGGPSLIAYLDEIEVDGLYPDGAFRLPVQYVNRPNQDFRGYSGRIAAGAVKPGDQLVSLPGGARSTVREVLRGFDAVEEAKAGESVTITLADEIDASRGSLLASAQDAPQVADQFEARILWLGGAAMTPGRQYILKAACQDVTATITDLKFREDVNTGAKLAAKTLKLNEIGRISFATTAPLIFEPYVANRHLGSFILVDKLSFETVGAGMIDFALRRSSNIHWQSLAINPAARASIKHQTPRCIWFTGLSGSGKSTIANALEKRLFASGRHTYILDGDNVRHGLNKDLGFTEADRVENIRRVIEVTKLMVDAGLIVIVSFISPFRSERRLARETLPQGSFFEVYVDTPIEECEKRDVKGLYAKARRGELKNFTGIDSAYEAPDAPEFRVNTVAKTPEAIAEWIAGMLD